MSRWWTPAHDEAATHLAMKIKAAQEARDGTAERQAWKDLDDLHGVKFTLARLDNGGVLVGEPIMLSMEGEADACIAQVGQGTPPAARAVLFPCERPDQTLRAWTWDGAKPGWVGE